MDEDKIMKSNLILLAFWMVQFAIIILWKKSGEISDVNYLFLIISELTIAKLVLDDILSKWRKNKEK